MSVITSWGATPNRLKIALRFVARCGPNGVTNDVLQQTLLPGALSGNQAQDDEPQGGSAIGDEVVDELRKLSLLIQRDDDSLTVSPDAVDVSEGRFVGLLQGRLLNPAEAAKHGQGAFPWALAWFLCQDPATPLSWEENYRGLVEADCGPESASFELTNRARCNQFAYWARFLGFAWRLNTDGKNTVIPDPTKAISRAMGRSKKTTDWQPIGEVLSRLAAILPVLEGGSARTEIESRLALEKHRPYEYISRSTSFALRRLERSRQIEMDRLADAQAMNLDFGPDLRSISHLKWTGTTGEQS